jgi:hypothetical protein
MYYNSTRLKVGIGIKRNKFQMYSTQDPFYFWLALVKDVSLLFYIINKLVIMRWFDPLLIHI